MESSNADLPTELRGVPARVLEVYVRSRILAVAGSAGLGRRLGMNPEAVRSAFADVLTEGIALRSSEGAEAQGPPLQLSFGHDCQSLGCLEAGCPLCAQNPNRRCRGCFSGKYLAGDVLKAKCGSSIHVDIVSRASLEPAPLSVMENTILEMCILDGKAYAALQEAGREGFQEDVEACIMPVNNQGKELLVAGSNRGATHNAGKWVVVPFCRGQAHLPDLTVTGSSEALLSGQKPPFRLLVRAVNNDGTPATHIRFLVSDAFVVATPRVRTAAKAEIPHLDDHVSKLHAVGNMTQNKLLDIQAAATAVGVYNIKVPHNTVTNVGQFRDVVEVAERDPQLCESLKKVLKLTRGWEIARNHVRMAVASDNQMRIWTEPPTAASSGPAEGAGLLYKCHLGSVDLEHPVGLLKLKEGSKTAMEALLTQQASPTEKEAIKKLQKRATALWWQAGHPGWAIWPVDTHHFMQDMSTPAGMLTADDLMTTTPADPPPPPERPVTRSATQSGTPQQEGAGPHAAPAESGHAMSTGRPAHSSTTSEGGSLDGWLAHNGRAPTPLSSSHADPGRTSQDPRFQSQANQPSMPALATQVPATQPQETLHFWEPGVLPGVPKSEPLDPYGVQYPPHSWDAACQPDPRGGMYKYEPAQQGSFDHSSARGPQLPEPTTSHAPSHSGMDFPAPFREPQNSPWGRPLHQGHLQQSPPQHHNPGMGGPPFQHHPANGLITEPANPAFRDHYLVGHCLDEHATASAVGRTRKRDIQHDTATTSFPFEQDEEPLASPFGLPELQNMDVPMRHHPPSGSSLLGHERASSGMEPAHPKRQHLTPQELQQRLSQLVGRPLGNQEMNQLIPNFPDLLDGGDASFDLPSLTLNTSDLAGLMDFMLEPPHKAQNPPSQTPEPIQPPHSNPQAAANGGHRAGAGGAAGVLTMDHYTYADLSEAVVDMQGGQHPTPQSRDLGHARASSHSLMDYLNARLAGAEGAPPPHQPFPQQFVGRVQPVNSQQSQSGPHSSDPGGEGLEGQRPSGLESMQDMGDSLL